MEDIHAISKNSIREPFDKMYQEAVFAMGCFWGAERYFWEMTGVFSTQVYSINRFWRTIIYIINFEI